MERLIIHGGLVNKAYYTWRPGDSPSSDKLTEVQLKPPGQKIKKAFHCQGRLGLAAG